jgi:hypothetical protein
MAVALNDPGKIESASLNNVAYALTQVHGALRLEEGKSTSNLSYCDTLKALREAKDELKKLNESNTQILPAEVSPPKEEPYSIPIIRESRG